MQGFLAVLLLVTLGCGPTSENKTVFLDSKAQAFAEACESGDLVAINRLIAEGADINAQSSDGVTPLLRALIAKKKDAYKVLLQAGANPNLRDRMGNAAVNSAAECSDPFFLELALRHDGEPDLINEGSLFSRNNTPLFYAVYKEHASNVALLIEAGAKLDHQDEKGYTPLHHASEGAAYDIVLMLLEAGADPGIKNLRGDEIVVPHFRGRSEDIVLPAQRPSFHKVMTFLEAKGFDLSTPERK